LYGVSCTQRAACTAVGTADGSGSGLVVRRSRGARWLDETHLRVPKNSGGALLAVSCITQRACMAVGYLEHNYTRATALSLVLRPKRAPASGLG
jgi:hypothetical protein